MNSTFTGYLYFLSILIALPGIAQAQEEGEKISTDRPDQSQGPVVVPAKTFQLEAGYFYQKQNSQVKTHAYPTALLRIGLVKGMELRLQSAWKDSVDASGAERKTKGFGPLSIGTKVHLWEASGWRPEAAVLAMVVLPVGSRAFRPDNPEPQIILSLANELPWKTDLTYNLGYGRADGTSSASYSATMARALTQKLTMYVEVFGSKAKGESAAHQGDLGLLYLLLPNLQLDVAAGRRLNKSAPHSFLASGLSVRLPR
ncbi:transporter [Pontibacter sp. JH31]|uniref:Transporter n=1 Tax=Pontibacter aquaedesilientis TaxID=2766980 RepID=A0ABR7XJG5_9BACT|nr:transporter [Pontibacter aquaedesilientis]MBD1397768.1 transporter [Pontibacter aquaedesilientis]